MGLATNFLDFCIKFDKKMPIEQPIQISLPNNTISLTIPSVLQQSFTITNLTLRPVIIYPILSHEDQLFLTTNNRIKILQAFEEIQLTLGLKSISIPVKEIIKPVLRVYFWEIKQFRDQDQLLLQQDEEMLKSPIKIKERNNSNLQQFDEKNVNLLNENQEDNQTEKQISEQQFANLMKRNRLKQQILEKYRQKMFSLKNVSNQLYEKLNTHKNIQQSPNLLKNKNISTKKTISPSYQQSDSDNKSVSSQSSYEQEVFSQLMCRDFVIDIKISDTLSVCSSFGSGLFDQKQLYLLENVIRPGTIQLSETQKRHQLEFIQNFLFRECQKLGKVKAIDRLNQDVLKNQKQQKEPIQNNYEYSSSQRSIRKKSIISNRQLKIASQSTSRSLTIKIPDRKISLQRYTIQYKSRLSTSHTSSNGSEPTNSQQIVCHFIQITTQKYFYVFKLTKILRYDFWYVDHSQGLKRKMSQLSNSQFVGKKKEERKKWKLPTLIDLDKIKLEEKRFHTNRFAVQLNSDIMVGLNFTNTVNDKNQDIQTNLHLHHKALTTQENNKSSELNSQPSELKTQIPQNSNEYEKKIPQIDKVASDLKVQTENQASKPLQGSQSQTIPKYQNVDQIQISELQQKDGTEQKFKNQNGQPQIEKPQVSIFEVPQYTRKTKSFSQKEHSDHDENQKYYSSLLEFNRQGHNFQTSYTGLQMLQKLSQQSKEASHQKIQNQGEDRIKEIDDEENDKTEELPNMNDSRSSSDKSSKQDEKRKKRPKFLFTSNDDLRNIEAQNSYANKKALLSQSFSHSFHPQLNLTHQEPKPEYIQELIVYPDPLLAMHILTLSNSSQAQQTSSQSHFSQKGPYVFLFFRTHLLYFPVANSQIKTTIKIDPLKVEDSVNYKTMMTAYKFEEIIVANGCYLYWIDLRAKSSEWKYVQRKEIFCVEVIEEMKLLAVGGKNFSKLSLFGKETSRSNIKIYNCGKTDRSHLFTYDIPINQPVGNVCEMKYITTPPSGGKLLVTYTNYNEEIFRLIFFRVRAYNNLEVYGKIELNDVGIQSIMSMKYNPKSQKLIVLEQVDPDHSALKRLKVKSMYEKAEVLTECVKMELGNYEAFQIGGEKQTEWYSLVSKGKNSALLYRTYKFHNNPETIKLEKYEIDAVFDINEGNQVLIKGYDFIKLKKRKKINKE